MVAEIDSLQLNAESSESFCRSVESISNLESGIERVRESSQGSAVIGKLVTKISSMIETMNTDAINGDAIQPYLDCIEEGDTVWAIDLYRYQSHGIFKQ